VAPRATGGPRIIHVPQPGERSQGPADGQDDEAAGTDDNDDSEAAPPPRRPLAPPRNVLSAPPPPATGLTPIYPTPKFDPKKEPAEKFAPPLDDSLAKVPPAGG